MLDELKKIEQSAREKLANMGDIDATEVLKIQFLGRKGALSLMLRAIKNLPEQERIKTGSAANRLRQELEAAFDKKLAELKKTNHESVLQREWIDVTRPGVKTPRGHLHPLTLVRRDAEAIFHSMGFVTVEGPEVESERYNFDALNIPANHPARDMWDTFWLRSNQKSQKSKVKSQNDGRLLLRTHTSPVQIRYMETHEPPFRIIAPGRVFRYEATDASHEIQFYQLEGLMVDRHVSIANFKFVIQEFLRRLFRKQNLEIRLRPSYFPFVEPGFEVDVACIVCNQKGCSVCKRSGWLEMMGAGMVHQKVFAAVGYVPAEWTGFAFGIGLDRVVMMKYNIPDIRLFHSGDLRFLKQF
ncbi:phenylalanine--tRNA ligase subunit alpha [Patescibacteria group bacterium]|nr:phenylalanine--tRNA ligase subunit alpha [Patescibacteria group bacterium]